MYVFLLGRTYNNTRDKKRTLLLFHFRKKNNVRICNELTLTTAPAVWYKKSYTWNGFIDMLQKYPLANPRIYVSVYQR